MDITLNSDQISKLNMSSSVLKALLNNNESSELKCDKAILTAALNSINSVLKDVLTSKIELHDEDFYNIDLDSRLPIIQVNLHYFDQNIFNISHIQFYMHDYSKDKPSKDGELLVKLENNKYIILWYSASRDEFLNPYNDWYPYSNDKIKGWINIS